MKCNFFQAVVMSILLYGCTTWMLTKCMEKKLNSNYTRMLQVILNKSWRQHPTKQQLYSYFPPIMKTIHVRWTGHAGHYWRSKDELISDILPWTPSHGQAKEGWPARTYIQQLCVNTGCNLEDLLEAIDDREGWGISMLMAWHGDDDSNLTKIICIVIKSKLPSRLGLQNILTVSLLKGKTPPLSVLNMI